MEILEAIALSVIIFFSILAIIVLRSGIHIHLNIHNETQPPVVPQEPVVNAVEQQKKIDEEYEQATNSLKEMAAGLQSFMTGNFKKQSDEGGKQNG